MLRWTEIELYDDDGSSSLIGVPPEATGRFQTDVPYWDTVLNLVRELEEGLSDDEHHQYIGWLKPITGVSVSSLFDDHLWSVRHATPAQCCEAWLTVKEG